VGLALALPQDKGFLAVVPISAPHLLLLTLLSLPLAAVVRDQFVILVAVASLASCVLILGDDWLSLPAATAPEEQVRLVSWNMEFGVVAPQEAVATLRAWEADVIALQELTHETADAIRADASLRMQYPYQALAPDDTVFGLGILSRHPIADDVVAEDPSSQTVRVAVTANRELTVVNAHPLPAKVGIIGFDATRRNADLDRLRARVDALLDSNYPVIVIGDLNVASTEPAFAEFAAGLSDVHRQVGLGPGWTWRPNRLAQFNVGVLRIDHVLVGEPLVPVHAGVECDVPGDHCAVLAAVAMP
jgi:endonuclease/exonuclease/phosphatase (EEP) superfamily protein YafD